ncbi:DUF222 domain-containing protein [Actinospongicola halichondriae]|uniref:HNH endonuclease signature motif containing protein n=1 Tax=Actinospongicola halichondriae TaxID=3236844 RepID=UPI003D391FE9
MFESGVGVRDVEVQEQAIALLCSSLDPALIHADDVSTVFDALVHMQKLVTGAVVRMSARFDEVGDWKRNGSRSAEDEIARKTGTSVGRARRSLQTSKNLTNTPGVDNALRQGDLSPDQADAVSSGASASPDDEDELLRTAKKESLQTLKQRAADARARADKDREATRRRHHAARRLHRWKDEDGMYNLHLKLPGEMGAEVDAALKPGIDRAFADARDAGRFEPLEAYAADVVHGLLTGASGGARSGSSAVRPERKVIGIVDVAALNRGHILPGETSVIAGVGPVSVSAIRAMLADAFVTIVFTDGKDIRNVTHLGRQVTAHQRTALELRGYCCEIDGCGSTHHLEIDHVTGWTLTRKTELDDLCWLCPHHHRIKTRKRLRLVGPIGARRYAPPDPMTNDPPPGVSIQDDLFTTAR